MEKPERQSLEIRPRRRLLIVDDEAPIREVLKSFLGKQGYHVATAATAAETLKLVNLLTVDLIILDVVLEDEDGLELLAKLKKTYPHCPVIIITGLAADDEVKCQALKSGAADCVSKISNLDQLLTSIQYALANAAPGPTTGGQAEALGRPRRAAASTRSGIPAKVNRRNGDTNALPQPAFTPGQSTRNEIGVATAAVEASTSSTDGQLNANKSPAFTKDEGAATRVTPSADPNSVAELVSLTQEGKHFQSAVEVFLRMLGGYHPNLANTAMRAVFLCQALGEILG